MMESELKIAWRITYVGIKLITISNDKLQKDFLSSIFCCSFTTSLEKDISTSKTGIKGSISASC